MARQILRRFPRTTVNRSCQVEQKFEYLLVMDFEATCKNNEMIKPQEIIEIPCAVLSTQDWQLKDTFHTYVKPRVHPILTPFCTELTGIMQETVNDQLYFADVFPKFCEWLTKGEYFGKPEKSTFVTCGNWDLKTMLPSQCDLDGLILPDYFKQWIDLKHTFCDATGYYPKSLKDMLVRLNIPLKGHLHSGIDDVTNMVSIILALKENYNLLFKTTSSLTTSTLNVRNYEQIEVKRNASKKNT
ncbi:hypothetical protein PUN28_007004 [Cardiocondyla obscurior]|uniref:Exonuclease domain-containing protein n=1 Tax=Cardiocondyla obscurior TaxID=286306 RepID=A0AAW2G3X2_9HYME